MNTDKISVEGRKVIEKMERKMVTEILHMAGGLVIARTRDDYVTCPGDHLGDDDHQHHFPLTPRGLELAFIDFQGRLRIKQEGER